LRISVELPKDLYEFCERYSRSKNLTVEGLVTLLVVQGIYATMEVMKSPEILALLTG